MDIGIDLGTTYSVIAVKGQVKLPDGFPGGIYLEECDVTIIPSPEGNPTFPSVFWVDPEDPSQILIGIDAKQKAEEGQSPIMFAKRAIGTNEPLKIHDRTFTAKEVATHTLRYLKECAERALGQPVRRAIVTHPAYFKPNQVDETREAADAAGFDMSLPEQMMMEPAAAALAYIKNDDRDPLRILTYDLGGGTFDVTVLERSEGDIKMKAYDGDPLLGGYNFDRALVQWILERIKAGGRDIPYDENNPEDRGRRARMLQLAESIKLKLYEQGNKKKAMVHIKAQDILIDSEGRKVQFTDKLNQEQYAELIKEHLDMTIRCCKNAIAKAGFQVEELHAILLVGGSTYGQWVQQAVGDAFNVEIVPYNPDLCVAAGAAIRAAELPKVTSGSELELTLDVQPVSPLPSINVSGSLRASDGQELGEELRAELKVLLRTPQGETRGPEGLLGANGQFLFREIPLLEDEASQFHLQVIDARGLERLADSFNVQYSPEGAGSTSISTSLPNPLYLRVAGEAGLPILLKIAEEGVQLPARCEVTLKRNFSEDRMSVPVILDDNVIGSVTVENIPEDAGEGSKVVITVEITEKNKMRGTARVLTSSGAVAAQQRVEVEFPPLQLPSRAALWDQFKELDNQRQQAIALSEDAEQRVLLGGRGKNIADKLKKLFDELEPDKQEVYREIKNLDRLVNPPPDDMEPPRAQFRRLLEDCRDAISAAGAKPELQAFQTQLQKVGADGDDAFNTRNQRKWAATYDLLVILHDRIQKATGGGKEGPEPELPPTPILKDIFQQEVDALRSALASKRAACQGQPDFQRISDRSARIEREIEQIDDAINKVRDNLDPKQALSQLRLALRPKPQLEKSIRSLDTDASG